MKVEHFHDQLYPHHLEGDLSKVVFQNYPTLNFRNNQFNIFLTIVSTLTLYGVGYIAEKKKSYDTERNHR